MAYGGGIILGSDRVCAGNELAKNITVMTENEFSDMLELMQNTLELLEFNVGIKKDNNDAKALTNRPANEYLYLKHRLSRREMDIAQAVCECLSNKQIGDKLFISEKTVKSHISNILAKMGMKDRMQLVMFCKEHGKE